jgi:hypothetical protein
LSVVAYNRRAAREEEPVVRIDDFSPPNPDAGR